MRVKPFLCLRNDLSRSVQSYLSLGTWMIVFIFGLPNGLKYVTLHFSRSNAESDCFISTHQVLLQKIDRFDQNHPHDTFWLCLMFVNVRIFCFLASFLATRFMKILFGPVASHFSYKHKVWAAFASFHFRHHETKVRYTNLKLDQLQSLQPKAFLGRATETIFSVFSSKFHRSNLRIQLHFRVVE